MLALAALGLKLLIVLGTARIIRPPTTTGLGAFLAAWVFVTGFCFALMFALSGAGSLSQITLWIALAAGVAICVPIAVKREVSSDTCRENRTLLLFFGVIWLAFAARALHFQDFTGDAQAYGLVRIALWMNYGTVFVHMPTPQLNVFANEWNGELLGLFYALAAGDLRGTSFANVEVILVTFLACAWLARLMGASSAWALAAAGLIALCPACLGLATTVKGDLLAICGSVLAFGWLIVLRADRTWLPATMLVACIGLAVGAKVIAIFPGIALACLGLAAAPRAFVAARTLLFGGALAALFLARFVVNAVVYGNPVQRIRGEEVEPGLTTFLSNLWLIARRTFGFGAHGPHEEQFFSWHLSGGLGVTGLALLLAIGAVFLARRRAPSLLVTALILSLLVALVLIPSRPYSLRYFLPNIVPLAVILFALAAPKRAKAWIAGALIVTVANLSYLFWPGEINGWGSFARAAREQIGRTTIERGFLTWEGRRILSRFDELGLDGTAIHTIAIFQKNVHEISQFMGSRAQHRIRFAGSADELTAMLRSRRADFAVVTQHPKNMLSEEHRDDIARAGYVWIENNHVYAIAARADRAEARTMGAVWRSGNYDVEQGKIVTFRWLQKAAEMEVAMSNGAACLVLSFFGTGRPERPQIVRIEGASVEPSEFDLAATDLDTHKQVRILVRNTGPSARLRFVTAMPEIQLPNDPRRIAFGVVSPTLIAPANTCR